MNYLKRNISGWRFQGYFEKRVVFRLVQHDGSWNGCHGRSGCGCLQFMGISLIA
jgi:hypothetical protein